MYNYSCKAPKIIFFVRVLLSTLHIHDDQRVGMSYRTENTYAKILCSYGRLSYILIVPIQPTHLNGNQEMRISTFREDSHDY